MRLYRLKCMDGGGSPPGFMMDSYREKNSASNAIGTIFGTKRLVN